MKRAMEDRYDMYGRPRPISKVNSDAIELPENLRSKEVFRRKVTKYDIKGNIVEEITE
jgi:hypothetical protein